jgi:hypothetical protein
MTPTLRVAGEPSPLLAGTHDDLSLRPAIPFDQAVGGVPELSDVAPLDPFDLKDTGGLPGWLVAATRMIRPLCVGALMAIPTLGAASVGVVALFNRTAAMNAVEASTAFLAGIPGDIVLLIGALATGYSLAKTIERLRGARV